MSRARFLPWVAAGALLALVAVGGRAAVVRDIAVESPAVPVDEASVLAYTSVEPGDEFSRTAVNRDVRSLQKSGRFSSIAAVMSSVPGGLRVTYVVQPKYRVRHLSIDGADYLSNKKVREKLELGAGDFVDDATLGAHALKVKEAYRKRYFPRARLSWTIEPVGETGMADVRITVDEGVRSSIRKIRFEGNENIPSRTLRKAMKQRPVNWLSWITGAGTYDPDELASDRQSLRRAYMDRGYLDAAVGEPEITRTRGNRIRIRIPVEEGRVYHVGGTTLHGTALFPREDVAKAVRIRTGDVASLEAVEATAQRVRDYYGSRGYIRTLVDYKLDVDPAAGVADVAYTVEEGRLAHIRDIVIRGNTRTKDKVIRRELAVYPGEIYNEVRVRTSERRLRNLGYFSYVNSMAESTSRPDWFDLVFDVEEDQTGQFLIGAGVSSEEEVLGFVELSQRNFDLFDPPLFSGGGQKLKLRSQFGTKRRDYEISFTEPWFLNRRLSLGLDLYRHDSKYFSDEYEQKTLGGSVTLGKGLTSFDRVNLTYGLEEIEVFNVKSNASERIRAEKGRRTKSYTTLELIHDTRNNVFVPTRGNRTTLSGTVAGGVLGGETDLYEVQLRSAQYVPLWFDHVLNLRGWVGMVERYGDSDRVPIFDRMFLGGARTIRGFKYRKVGPKDENGEPLGGKSVAYGTVEYTIPVAEQVRLAAFYDAGTVWGDLFKQSEDGTRASGDGDFNSSYGIGLRFDFRSFPIQLDYSWPIDTDDYNERPQGRFSFWLGYGY